MRKILFVYALLCNLMLSAQTALKLQTFNMTDGLPSNTITKMVKADNGMLWIATWNGLCNYDGYGFNLLTAPIGENQVFSGRRIHFIVPMDNGDVWVTTSDDHLYLYDSKERIYIDYQPKLEQLGLVDFEVNNMRSLRNGAVWVLGKDGQNLRIQKDKHEVVPTSLNKTATCSHVTFTDDGSEWMIGKDFVRRYGTDEEIQITSPSIFSVNEKVVLIGDKILVYNPANETYTEEKLPADIKKIFVSKQMSGSKIAIATDAGVYTFDIESKDFSKEYALALNNIYCDKQDRLWSVLDNGTAMLIDTKNHTSKTLGCSQPNDWPKIKSEQVIVHEDANGLLWVLLQGKTFCWYDENKETLVPIDLRTINNNIPTEMTISKVVSDSHKNLWFYGLFNLCKLTFSNYYFQEIHVATGEETRSMYIDEEGRCWAGTRNGHIVILDDNGNKVGYLSSKGTISATDTRFCESGIFAIFKDKKQRLWIGTRGSGLFLLDTDGSVKSFVKAKGYPTCGDDYFDIQDDGNGHLWFATYMTGMMYLDQSAETDESGNLLFHYADNCENLRLPEGNINKIRSIEVLDNVLLFSTSDGVVTIDSRFKSPEDIKLNISSYSPNNAKSLRSRDVMQTLPCSKSQNIYVATLGGGMHTIASENLLQNSLEFNHVPILFSNIGAIRGMVEDQNGKIWIASENAIHTLSVEGQNQRSYTSVDWGKNIEFCEARPVLNPKDNSIIMGTLGGVIKFHPEDIVQNKFVPSLVFTGIRYQGEESIVPLVGNEEVELPVDNHNALIFFAALDYVDNSQIRYAYRIKELDKTWNYVGAEHCAPLSNLPSGHYTLEVRSTNNEGIWIDNNTEQRIYVEPTFWQTPWAWIIYLLVFAFILYDIIFLIQLKNAHRVEKEINKRQLHFFTDISHQLRTPLTLIGGPVTEVLNTEQLSEKAKTYLQFVENNANKMLELVNKTLDLKKLKVFNESISSTSISEDLQKTEAEEGVSVVEQNFDSSDLTILVVEDNDELRYFLSNTLSTHYNIIEASNGKVGLQMAAEHQPDFIITDIMMPEMDGITMIRRIKCDESICHIPIIILSARTADVYRIEGLKEGADDYITKPFSVSYLQVRVESIVRQRRLLQETWRKKLLPDNIIDESDIQVTEISVSEENQSQAQEGNNGLTPLDMKFTTALTEFIEQNIANENLRIDDIASAMCMSRTVLYGKIKSIYGNSPNDIVRQVRIAKACTLLREDFTKSVTEIAISVGFSEPKYFARCFKQSTGMTPTEYRKQG